MRVLLPLVGLAGSGLAASLGLAEAAPGAALALPDPSIVALFFAGLGFMVGARRGSRV
ncbi:MAG: hypothetical protein JO290_09530 [Sphingomonadaceae bacterium]|nr:hypothetical protein [Sphingomonadaceae bacterium]